MSSLHPEMAAILAEQQAAPVPAPETLPIGVARTNFTRANAAWNVPQPPMGSEVRVIGGVTCTLLTPAAPRPGVIVFVHGGGWTFGSPATHDRFARLLAAGAGRRVLVPDYRLAPEHPAPAAIQDVLSVIAGYDAQGPLALCGDSAGANIALAAALDTPARRIAMLSLLYGCFAPDFGTASHARNGGGTFGLTTARMRWYWRNWLGDAADPRAAPLGAELAGLPFCHLVAAGLDPLCDDSLLLASKLAVAGVEFRLDVVPGVVHGFLQMTARLRPAAEATRMIARVLGDTLAAATEEAAA